VVEPYLSEKYEFISWEYYSQYMEKYKMFQTTNQLMIHHEAFGIGIVGWGNLNKFCPFLR